MPEWQMRCGKRQCRSDERNPALRRDRGDGCVRVRYQTMGTAGQGNRERPFSPTCADQQIEPSQGRLRGKERFSMPRPSGPYRFSSGKVSDNSVAGMSVLVACDLNLHHYTIDFIYFGFEAGSVDP
jgi:hypothetical protein